MKAVSLLAFVVLACQCMSTLPSVRRETRSWRRPAFVLGYTYVLAYVAAAVAFQITRLLTALASELVFQRAAVTRNCERQREYHAQ